MRFWREGEGAPEKYLRAVREMKERLEEYFIDVGGWTLCELDGSPYVEHIFFSDAAPFSPKHFEVLGVDVYLSEKEDGLWALTVNNLNRNALVAIGLVEKYLDTFENFLQIMAAMVGDKIWKYIISTNT